MAIQKFKFGQEITSAKLNEIVSFLNSLENNLNLLEYYNSNIQGKLDAFSTQINILKEETESLLLTAENYDLLANKFTTILTQYYALLQGNVETLFQEYFNNISITPADNDGNSFWVFGNEVTSFLAGVKGDKGDQGIQGIQGIAGTDGSVLHFGSGAPSIELGLEGDGYLDYTNFRVYYKEILSGAQVASWVIKGNTFKGDTGAPGRDGFTTQIEFRYLNTINDPSPSSTPKPETKYIEFRTYYIDSLGTQQGNPSTWIRLQTRSTRYIPIIDQENGTLRWALDEGNVLPSLDPVNIIGPQGVKGDKGDSGNEFVVLGIKANTGALPVSGTAGQAWFVGTTTPYNVYLWDTGLSTPTWVNVGTLQGPTGATGATGSTGAQGPTGPRGSRVFHLETGTVETVVDGTTYDGVTLIVRDIFIEEETGRIMQVESIDSGDNPPVTFNLIYQLASSNELAYEETKVIPMENIEIGDVIQFVAIKNNKKLVAKATPYSGVSLTYNNVSYPIPNVNDNPELIMGIAAEDANAGANGFKVILFGYIKQFDPSYLSFTLDETAILYFDSNSTEFRGRLTKTEPPTNKINLVCAVFLGDNQDTLLVRVGHSYNISDIRNLQNVLDTKAPINSPTFTGTVAGITKAMVGLGNVDNTSDANKPVSTAQQTALNLKANLAGPTFTGIPSAPTATAGTNTTQIATTQFVQSGLSTKASSSHTHAISDVTNLQTNLNNKTEVNDLEWRFHGYTKTNITLSAFTIDTSNLYKADGITAADSFDIDNFDYKFVYYAAVNVEASTGNIDEDSENDGKIIKLRINNITDNQRYAYVAQRIVFGTGFSGATVYEDNRGERGNTSTARSSYIQTILTLDSLSEISSGTGITYNKMEFVISESYASSSSQTNGIIMVEGEGSAVFGNIGTTTTLNIGSSKAWFTGTVKNVTTLTSVNFLDTIGYSSGSIELQKVQVYRRKRWQ
jgi:hypothetical protein